MTQSDVHPAAAGRASRQSGTYPRPQLVRPDWADLSGPWEFSFGGLDDPVESRVGVSWSDARSILVPFPPESPASGIAEPGYHEVLWYRRTVTQRDIEAAGYRPGQRLVVHFGAVDYRARVWAGGDYLGGHEGGHTPFSFDLTALAGSDFELIVRVEDDPLDLEQPRGKQDWQADPHVIWYHRTSGIWQPVWLEAVPPQHLAHLAWRTDIVAGRIDLDYELAQPVSAPTVIRVQLDLAGSALAEVRADLPERRGTVSLSVPQLGNGQDLDAILWSPDHPHLVDAAITLSAGGPDDEVRSYLGIRSVATGGGSFLVNGRPHPIRAVLSQGYWPQSHLAAPDAAALRAEVELIKALGFTTARLHQKLEDPRLLYWADRLGLLLWAELPSALRFSPTTVGRLAREWMEAIRRDSSHPSIVVWVPMNESWGVQQVAHDPAQQHTLQALYHLTKALDPSRPVISNDGWEHADSDLFTIHDYSGPAELEERYRDREAARRLVDGFGQDGHRLRLLPAAVTPGLGDAPVVVSEFGGISWADPASGGWGYRTASGADQFEEQLRATFGALQSSPVVSGWCYTQLTDTAQETNGLVDEDRRPKLPTDLVRAIVLGTAPPR